MTRRGQKRAGPPGGFTLLELLVVLALLGVVSLLAISGSSPLWQAARERGWIDRLHAELIRARAQARALGTVSSVSFLPEQGEIRFQGGPQQRVLSLLPSNRGDPVETAADQRLYFFPDGTASDVDLSLVVGSRTVRLRVNGVTGKIELGSVEPSS